MTDEQKTMHEEDHMQPDAASTPGEPDQNGAGEQGTVVEGVVESATESELRQRLAAAEAQAAEYKDQWMRERADFKNYKRRAELERTELIRSASAGLVMKLLPVMDDFERAAASVPPEIASHPWWSGAVLIGQKLRTVLESEAVTAIDAVGEDFDPNLHEAVLYEDADGQDGKVIEELQKGYRMGDRVLRPTMVKVGKG